MTMWLQLTLLLVAYAGLVESVDGNSDCLDIAFRNDTSRSISQSDWILLQDFLGSFINTFSYPGESFHFAAANYARSANLVFNLGDMEANPPNNNVTYDLVRSAIMSIEPERNVTKQYKCLQVVLDDLDDLDDPCPDVMVLITDGRNNTGGNAIALAELLKARGVDILTLAIGDDTVTELWQEISSLVLNVHNFGQLEEIADDLKTMSCFSP